MCVIDSQSCEMLRNIEIIKFKLLPDMHGSCHDLTRPYNKVA